MRTVLTMMTTALLLGCPRANDPSAEHSFGSRVTHNIAVEEFTYKSYRYTVATYNFSCGGGITLLHKEALGGASK